VRALLEKNKSFTSICLAFLSRSLVLAVDMHFTNNVDSYPMENLLNKQFARKFFSDEVEMIPAQ